MSSYDEAPPADHPRTRLTDAWAPINHRRYYDNAVAVITYHRLGRDENERLRDEYRQLVYRPARGYRTGTEQAPAFAWVETDHPDTAAHLFEQGYRATTEQWQLMSQPLLFETSD